MSVWPKNTIRYFCFPYLQPILVFFLFLELVEHHKYGCKPFLSLSKFEVFKPLVCIVLQGLPKNHYNEKSIIILKPRFLAFLAKATVFLYYNVHFLYHLGFTKTLNLIASIPLLLGFLEHRLFLLFIINS